MYEEPRHPVLSRLHEVDPWAAFRQRQVVRVTGSGRRVWLCGSGGGRRLRVRDQQDGNAVDGGPSGCGAQRRTVLSHSASVRPVGRTSGIGRPGAVGGARSQCSSRAAARSNRLSKAASAETGADSDWPTDGWRHRIRGRGVRKLRRRRAIKLRNGPETDHRRRSSSQSCQRGSLPHIAQRQLRRPPSGRHRLS